MEITERITVFDAADLAGRVRRLGRAAGRPSTGPRTAVQLAPDHQRPQWPDGTPQQIHLDLYITDLAGAHAEAVALGAELLQAAEDPDAAQGFQVYADPAGHPFCLCWG